MNLNQHPKRGILKDIDKATLVRMRQEGMSNQEIADHVGCSYQTIRNILGKQPPGMRRQASSPHRSSTPSVQVQPVQNINLAVKPIFQSVEGEVCRFDIDYDGYCVKMTPISSEDGFRISDMPSVMRDIAQCSKFMDRMGEMLI